MPNAEKYARYRADQTTIWVSKTAAGFLTREKERPGEGAGAVLDRLIGELRRLRRAQGPGTKQAGAKSAGAKSAGAKSAGAKTAGAKSAGAKSAAGKQAAGTRSSGGGRAGAKGARRQKAAAGGSRR